MSSGSMMIQTSSIAKAIKCFKDLFDLLRYFEAGFSGFAVYIAAIRTYFKFLRIVIAGGTLPVMVWHSHSLVRYGTRTAVMMTCCIYI